jgi:hypothetical protein
MDTQPFLTPRLVGSRFEGGVIPLHVLADFAVLEQMVVDVAKFHFRKESPNRKRLPRGFADDVTLKLTGLESGSAKPVISLCFLAKSLFEPVAVEYYEKAKESIVGAIAEAEQNQPITKLTPDQLEYFSRFGRSLEPGEYVEFPRANSQTPAVLNQATRHKLVIASTAKDYKGDVVVHGTICEMDKRLNQFKIQRVDGTIVSAPIGDKHKLSVQDGFNNYEAKQRIRIYASGVFDRQRQLKEVDSVEQIVFLEADDIRWRIEELKLLKQGWLDGKGTPPAVSNLDWLATSLLTHYPDDLQPPYLFPTTSGNIVAEWSIGYWSPSLDIDFTTLKGFWHSLNTATDDEFENEIDLRKAEDWEWMAEQIRKISGGQNDE